MIRNESALITAGIEVGLIQTTEIDDLRHRARKERRSLMDLLMFHKRIPLSAFFQALAKQYGLAYRAPERLQLTREVSEKLGLGLMLRKNFLVLQEGDKSFVVTSEPNDRVLVDIVQRSIGGKVELAIAEPDAIRFSLQTSPLVEVEIEKEEFDSVLTFDEIMKQAYVRRASDIHLEPGRFFCQLRMRVDGKMQTLALRMDEKETEALVNRIKVLSNMDISEQRMPQDGGMTYQIIDWDVPESDIRVASVPTKWGERITMRILGDVSSALQLEQLGMPEQILQKLKNVLSMPHGMLLVTGPTGSGKSTTLYASIRDMNSTELNILTAEDPVEQNLPGISQVQMTSKVNFSSALRSFLRHDPDVILVGEVRDLETAETALKASMTGHLVLSTLHTNDSVSAIARLVNLGCDRFLVGTTVVGVLAQRLAPKLCKHCKESYQASVEEKALLGVKEETTLYRPQGCPICNGTGRSGRVGLYEAFWVEQHESDLILDAASEKTLKASDNFYSIWQNARQRILDGEVFLDDVAHYHHSENDE